MAYTQAQTIACLVGAGATFDADGMSIGPYHRGFDGSVLDQVELLSLISLTLAELIAENDLLRANIKQFTDNPKRVVLDVTVPEELG